MTLQQEIYHAKFFINTHRLMINRHLILGNLLALEVFDALVAFNNFPDALSARRFLNALNAYRKEFSL
jgi:hypothetical protein